MDIGNNIGCKYLIKNNIDYIVISNPDVIFEEEDILKLCKPFKKDEIAIVSPVIKEKENLNRGLKFRGPILDALTNINYIGRMFKKISLYKDKHYASEYSKVDVVSGCFFLIKAEILEEIGYFDENVFLYYEENILAKKLQKIGKSIIVDNNIQIIHNHSVSINKSYNKIKKFKILAKSQRYYHKKYNKANVIQMMALYVSYYITLAISYILCIFKKNNRRQK